MESCMSGVRPTEETLCSNTLTCFSHACSVTNQNIVISTRPPQPYKSMRTATINRYTSSLRALKTRCRSSESTHVLSSVRLQSCTIHLQGVLRLFVISLILNLLYNDSAWNSALPFVQLTI
ncbi:hypothetical protein COOONC_24589 [Cooperia oncophora]